MQRDELFPDLPSDREGSATLSPDGRYRYDLVRRWALGPTLCWVMLNPSTADAEHDDPTLRRVIGFSRAAGAGRAVVVNLFALRSPDTRQLLRASDPLGPDCDAFIDLWARNADRVVVGWGAFTLHRWAWRNRPADVADRLRELRPDGLWCVGKTNGGSPRHPLYVPAATGLTPYTGSPVRR